MPRRRTLAPHTWRVAAVPALLVTVVAAACGAGPQIPVAASTDRSTAAPATPTATGPGVTRLGWPEALGDGAHSSPAQPGLLGPSRSRIRWVRQLGGPIAPGPVVGPDGTVYAASNAGDLHALDPRTGKDRWRFSGDRSYGGDLSTSAALTGNGILLWPGPDATLYGLRARDGKLLWRLSMGAQVLSPALGTDGEVYVQDQRGRLAAIRPDIRGPHQIWTVELGEHSYSSPAVAGDGTVVTATEGKVVGLAGSSGRTRWTWTAPATVEVSPAVSPDGTVVVGLNDPYVYGIRDGRTTWRWTKTDWSYSSPVATRDGKVYLGDHTAALDVLGAADGRLVRRTSIPAPPGDHPDGVGVWTSVAVDSIGDAYFGTAAGHIYGVDPQGRILFDLPTAGAVYSYPALGPDGTVYIGSADGLLRAVGPGG